MESELEIVFDVPPQISNPDIEHLVRVNVFDSQAEGFKATLIMLDSVLTEDHLMLKREFDDVCARP
jgi:hypothetical protein